MPQQSMSEAQAVVRENYEAFRKQLPELMREHAGKWAVIRDGQVVHFADRAVDAELWGEDHFPDARFSFQEVTDHVENLGFYTYAIA